jgi:hypothetical protein
LDNRFGSFDVRSFDPNLGLELRIKRDILSDESVDPGTQQCIPHQMGFHVVGRVVHNNRIT